MVSWFVLTLVGSLLRVGLFVNWFVRRFVLRLVAWFFRNWFVGSLVRWFALLIGLLSRSFAGSFVEWLVGSFVEWVVGSLVRRMVRS